LFSACGDLQRYSTSNYWVYILPPILYPDNRWYLKVGEAFHDQAEGKLEAEAAAAATATAGSLSGRSPAMPGKQELLGEEEVLAWYRLKGGQAHHGRLMGVLSSLFPTVEVLSSHSDACVTCMPHAE
jgi:hypothetical protein